MKTSSSVDTTVFTEVEGGVETVLYSTDWTVTGGANTHKRSYGDWVVGPIRDGVVGKLVIDVYFTGGRPTGAFRNFPVEVGWATTLRGSSGFGYDNLGYGHIQVTIAGDYQPAPANQQYATGYADPDGVALLQYLDYVHISEPWTVVGKTGGTEARQVTGWFTLPNDKTVAVGHPAAFMVYSSESLGFTIDYGDGTTASGTSSKAGTSLQHTYTKHAGSFPVRVTWTDDLTTSSAFVPMTQMQPEKPGPDPRKPEGMMGAARPVYERL